MKRKHLPNALGQEGLSAFMAYYRPHRAIPIETPKQQMNFQFVMILQGPFPRS
jgi:hypothetical protein